MTAPTVTARRDEGDAAPRPVPWRRMAGVIWRQHRIALAGVAVLVGAVAVWVWIEGASVHHAWDAAIACHPASSAACQDLAGTFNGTWDQMGYAAIFLQLLPALIGAFVGAPVLARELETGTFRYAWTQGFGRWRWALAKLVTLAVVLVAATGAFSVLLSWCYQPYLAAGNQARGLYGNSPLVTVFSLREVTFPAWTLAVFAIGALAGMLIRRVVPAIAATLAAYTGLAVVAGLYLRQHYLTPLLASNLNVPGSAWIISQQWLSKGGQPVSQSVLSQVLQQGGPELAGKGGVPDALSSWQYLVQHGYTLRTVYQPASRFWTFQWIEGGWLLALSALLIAATVWIVRRHAQ
jgi:hypothetical protein